MTPLEEILHQYAIKHCKKIPDALGEILRAWAFTGKGLGCYWNLDVRPV